MAVSAADACYDFTVNSLVHLTGYENMPLSC